VYSGTARCGSLRRLHGASGVMECINRIRIRIYLYLYTHILSSQQLYFRVYVHNH